jgi:hypothetical protein
MIDVKCDDCGEEYQVNEHYLADLIDDGDVRVEERLGGRFGRSIVHDYFGICKSCQRLHKAADKTPRKRGTVQEEAAHYQRLIAEERRKHPTWTIRSCQRAAAKRFHNPYLEPDPAFRAYLLDG